jgi:hypothetical protein
MRTAIWIAILMMAYATFAMAGHERASKPSFAFLYATGWGTRLDTYHGTITKDLILLPDTTVPCILSETDLDSVRQEMIAIHFFEMQEPHPDMHLGDTITTRAPSTTIRLEATLGSQTESLSWNTALIVPNEGDWKKLGELQALIWRIINRQPQYKALPPPRGNYL